MPVVKTETIYCNGTPFKKQIRVQSDGKFRVTLPPQMALSLGYNELHDAKLDALERKFEEAQEEYRKQKTTTEKVILYNVQRNAYIMRPDAEGDDICVFQENEISFCKGTALAVWAGVFEEFATRRDNGDTFYRYETVEDDPLNAHKSDLGQLGVCHGNQAEQRLQWSPKREAFFVQLQTAMESLILKLTDIITDPKTLTQLADGGKFLLPAPSKDDNAQANTTQAS